MSENDYGETVMRELRLLAVLRNLVGFAEELCETKVDYDSPELTAARAVLAGEPALKIGKQSACASSSRVSDKGIG